MFSKINLIIKAIEKKNSIIIGLGTNLSGNLILFLTTMYMTNNVTEDQYGQFRLTFALVSILVISLMLGRDSSVLYFYQKEKTDKAILEEVFSGLALVVVGCLALYYCDDYILKYLLNGHVSRENYHLSILMIPLWAAYNLLTPVVRVKGFINTSFILSNLIQRVLRFPFLLAFVWLGYNNFWGLAWSMILSQLLLLVVLIVYVSSLLSWRLPNPLSFFSRFGYSFSLGMNAILLAVAGKIDVIVIGKLSTISNVAIYDIVTSLAVVSLFPYIALSKSYEPKLFNFFENTEKHPAYKKNFTLSLSLTTVAGLFFILFSQDVLALFGKEYIAGSLALIIISIFFIMIACTGAVNEWMTMNSYARINFFILLISGIVNVFLCYLLVPDYGLPGAAVALGGALLFSKVAAMVFIAYKHNVGMLIVNYKQLLIVVSFVAISLVSHDLPLIIKCVIYLLLSSLLILLNNSIRQRVLKLGN
ncbi:lipopolysaccharide biosynthesis protein [Erwinia sorbitola]|uniref:Oligosaccharide flippase family protein n=1 Tax=Erwinia sorbitola TaxID=2681984 RepID=A0A6I6EBA1_9GAMM|nr:oligosaccharide flippase family protein [Erwinia sorbitola]MTD26399.1 oligosaccharide flippase family protein [Erwinia sorbitola]QGU87014.1 oligosaccharide flippase family protein [Erwinia sorbitola]